MLECLWFVIYGIVTTAAARHDLTLPKAENKHRSVNLALETVLEFDKKDNARDMNLLDNVHHLIGSIKNVIDNNNILRRDSRGGKIEKFTDFIQMVIKSLLRYDNNDLEDLFAIISEEMRKYHYRGCKFNELTDNNELRRFIAKTLDEFKNLSGDVIKKKLTRIADKIERENYDKNEKELIDFINSLYRKEAVDIFNNILTNIDDYRHKTRRNMNMVNIVRNGVRSVFFDYYTDLNFNARAALKTKLNDFWTYVMDVKSLLRPPLNRGIIITTRHDRKDFTKANVVPKDALRNKGTIYEDTMDWEYEPNLHKHWHKEATTKKHVKKLSFMTLYPAFVAEWSTPIVKHENKDLKRKTKAKKHKTTSKKYKESRTLRQMYMEKNLDLKYDPYAYDNLTTEIDITTERDRTRTKGHRHRHKSKQLKVVTLKPYAEGKIKKFKKYQIHKLNSNAYASESHETEKHSKKYEIHLKKHKSHTKLSKEYIRKPKEKTGHAIGLLLGDETTITVKSAHPNLWLEVSATKPTKPKRFRTISRQPTHPEHSREVNSEEDRDITSRFKHSRPVTVKTNRPERSLIQDSLSNDDFVKENLRQKHPLTFKFPKDRQRKLSITTEKHRIPYPKKGIGFFGGGLKGLGEGKKLSSIKPLHKESSVITYQVISLTDDNVQEIELNVDTAVPKPPDLNLPNTEKKEEEFSEEQEIKEEVSENPELKTPRTVSTATTNQNSLLKEDNGNLGDDLSDGQITTPYPQIQQRRTKSAIPTDQYKYSMNIENFSEGTMKEMSVTAKSSRFPHLRTDNTIARNKYKTPSREDITPYKHDFLEEGPREDTTPINTQVEQPSSELTDIFDARPRSSKEEEAMFDDSLWTAKLQGVGELKDNQLKNYYKNRRDRDSRRSNRHHGHSEDIIIDDNILNRLQKLENDLKFVKTQIKDDNEIIEDLKMKVRENEDKHDNLKDRKKIDKGTHSFDTKKDLKQHKLAKKHHNKIHDRYSDEHKKKYDPSDSELKGDKYKSDKTEFKKKHLKNSDTDSNKSSNSNKYTSKSDETDTPKAYDNDVNDSKKKDYSNTEREKIDYNEKDTKKKQFDSTEHKPKKHKKYKEPTEEISDVDKVKSNIKRIHRIVVEDRDISTDTDKMFNHNMLKDEDDDKKSKHITSNIIKTELVKESKEIYNKYDTDNKNYGNLEKYNSNRENKVDDPVTSIKDLDDADITLKQEKIIFGKSQFDSNNRIDINYGSESGKAMVKKRKRDEGKEDNTNLQIIDLERDDAKHFKESNQYLYSSGNEKRDERKRDLDLDLNKAGKSKTYSNDNLQDPIKDKKYDLDYEEVIKKNYVGVRHDMAYNKNTLSVDSDDFKTDNTQNNYNNFKKDDIHHFEDKKTTLSVELNHIKTSNRQKHYKDSTKNYVFFKSNDKTVNDTSGLSLNKRAHNTVDDKYHERTRMERENDLNKYTSTTYFTRTTLHTKPWSDRNKIVRDNSDVYENKTERTIPKQGTKYFEHNQDYEKEHNLNRHDVSDVKDSSRQTSNNNINDKENIMSIRKDKDRTYTVNSDIKQITKENNPAKEETSQNAIFNSKSNKLYQKLESSNGKNRRKLEIDTELNADLTKQDTKYGNETKQDLDKYDRDINNARRTSTYSADLIRNKPKTTASTIEHTSTTNDDTTKDQLQKYTFKIKPNKAFMDDTLKLRDTGKYDNDITKGNKKILTSKTNTYDEKTSTIDEMDKELIKNKLEKVLLDDDWEQINPSKMFSEIDEITFQTEPYVDRKLLTMLTRNFNRETSKIMTTAKTMPVESSTLFPEAPPHFDALKVDEGPMYVDGVHPHHVLHPAQFVSLQPLDKADTKNISYRPFAPMVGELNRVVENPAMLDRDIRERYHKNIKSYTMT